MFRVANADTPDYIANYGALESVDILRTGVVTRSGLLLTTKMPLFVSGSGVASEIVACTLP